MAADAQNRVALKSRIGYMVNAIFRDVIAGAVRNVLLEIHRALAVPANHSRRESFLAHYFSSSTRRRRLKSSSERSCGWSSLGSKFIISAAYFQRTK